MSQPQVQRPDPTAVKAKAREIIQNASAEATAHIAEAQHEYENIHASLTEEEQNLVAEARVLLQDGLQESDGKVAAQLHIIDQKHNEVQRLILALAEARAAEKSERARLKEVTREVAKEKKGLKAEFNNAAAEIHTAILQKDAEARQVVTQVAAEEKEKVKQVTTEVQAEVQEEKQADREYRAWKSQDTWTRRKAGFSRVISGLRDLFNQGFDEADGVELPARLKERAANSNDEVATPGAEAPKPQL